MWLTTILFALLLNPNVHGISSDPVLGFPAVSRNQDVSDWNRLLFAYIDKESHSVIHQSAVTRDVIRQKLKGTLPFGELFYLEAWGASGDPRAVRQLTAWFGRLGEPFWTYSVLAGLARSMDPKAHDFVVDKLRHVDMGQLPTRIGGVQIEPWKLLVFPAIADPLSLNPLLADPRTASIAARILVRVPHPGQAKAWHDAAQERRVTPVEYLSWLEKVFPVLDASHREQACSLLWRWLQPAVGTLQETPLFSILAQCPNAGVDARWVALLGRDPMNLLLLRAIREQPHIRLQPGAQMPLQALLKEYSGQSGWERILLDVLGQVRDQDTVKTVASYVLHNNLWLREQALSSLSLGAHPLAGRMLHAAALENAGEEAVLYFLPYLYQTRNMKEHKTNHDTLRQVATRYLRASEASYVQAAVITLAMSSAPDRIWWPYARKIADDLISRREWQQMAGFLPVLARSDKSVKYLRDALGHPDPAMRIGAGYALAQVPMPVFKKQLASLARSANRQVAANAAFALSRMPGSLRENMELASHPFPSVKAHAINGLARMAPENQLACATLLEAVRAGHLPVGSMQVASTALLGSCGSRVRSRTLRWIASLPAALAELLPRDLFLSGFRENLPRRAFFMRLINMQHMGVPGRAFQLTLPGELRVTGYSTYGGLVYLPGLSPEMIQLEWIP